MSEIGHSRPGHPGRLHYGWIILAVSTLSTMAALGLARLGYSIILPSMQDGLGLNNTDAGILATANLTGYVVLAIIGGMLASHLGPRTVVTIGLITIGAGMLLTGIAAGFSDAMVWRTITGLGAGAANVPAVGLVSGWFAPRRRGLATGIAVAGSSLGLILLGPTVPWVLAVYGQDGWRLCWLGMGAGTMVIALLAGLLLRNRPQDLHLQPVGAENNAPASPVAGSPANWSVIYKSPAMWHLGFVYVAYGFAYMVYMTFFTKALIAQGGYTPQAAGTLFMIMGWFSLPCGLIWGSVSDRLGRKAGLVIVYLIHVVAFGVFALHPTPAGFTLSAILFGLTAFSIPGITAAACGDMLGARLAPAGLGFVTFFLGIGQAVGPTIAGMMADVTHSYLPAVLLSAIISLAGAIGALFLRPSSIVCD